MLLHFAGVKAFYTPKIYDESIIACPTLIAKRFLNISAEAFSFSVGGNSDSRLLLTADGWRLTAIVGGNSDSQLLLTADG